VTDQPTTTYRPTDVLRHLERVGDEALIYDVETDTVLRLTPEAVQVWDACVDGATAAAIEVATGLSAARVEEALAELGQVGLIESDGNGGVSRRRFVTNVGLGLVAAAGLSLVTSIAAPTPASAQSAPGGGGGQSGGGDDCTTDCG